MIMIMMMVNDNDDNNNNKKKKKKKKKNDDDDSGNDDDNYNNYKAYQTYQKMFNQILGLWAHIIPVRRIKTIRSTTNLLKQSGLIAIMEWRITAQQNVHDHTQWPHINFAAIHVALKNLRSNIPRRTTICFQTTSVCTRGGLSKTKIS